TTTRGTSGWGPRGEAGGVGAPRRSRGGGALPLKKRKRVMRRPVPKAGERAVPRPVRARLAPPRSVQATHATHAERSPCGSPEHLRRWLRARSLVPYGLARWRRSLRPSSPPAVAHWL